MAPNANPIFTVSAQKEPQDRPWTAELQAMRPSRAKLGLSVAAIAVLAAVAATPQLLGPKVASAFDALNGADPGWLAAGAGGFALAFLATVGAWRAALAAAGGAMSPRQAAARLGVGSL